MCGIYGVISKEGSLNNQLELNQLNTLSHRGPDYSGYYSSSNEGHSVFIGHNRLSIIDVSDAANQPFTIGDYVIAFNGEVYNYRDLMQELRALNHQFKSFSDTEVVLRSFIEWGTDCVKKFHGMWSFVIYNKVSRTLYMCRDRVGVKPLFYFKSANSYRFASEIKALRTWLGTRPNIDSTNLDHYLNFGYALADSTIYCDIRQVTPGTWNIVSSSMDETVKTYWDSSSAYNKEYSTELSSLPRKDLKMHVKQKLLKSFERRMVSDVDLGVFLSGGVDSSLLAILLSNDLGYRLNTFTIGFSNHNYDETEHAKAVANSINSKHVVEKLDQFEAKKILGFLNDIYDEPFADYSAIPTLLVSRLASKYVKVVLSADGGDELFLGYKRYEKVLKVNGKKRATLPSIHGWFNFIISYLPIDIKKKRELHKLANRCTARDVITLYDMLVSEFGSSISQIDKLIISRQSSIKRGIPDHALLSIHELDNYIRNNSMVKVDRASMHYSLESREPFLDQDLISLAVNLPYCAKYDTNLGGKAILKEILLDYMPENFVTRKKQGFGIPIKDWMKSLYLFDNGSFNRNFNTKLLEEAAKYTSLYYQAKIPFSERVWRYMHFESWLNTVNKK